MTKRIRPSDKAEFLTHYLALNESWNAAVEKILFSRTRGESKSFLVAEMLKHDGTGPNNVADLIFTAIKCGIDIGLAIAEDEAISPIQNERDGVEL